MALTPAVSVLSRFFPWLGTGLVQNNQVLNWTQTPDSLKNWVLMQTAAIGLNETGVTELQDDAKAYLAR